MRARSAGWWDRVGDWPAELSRYRLVAWLPLGILIGIAWLVTYAAGGTSSGLPHLFYLPIFLAAFVYGPLGGIAAGLVGGLVSGAIPVDVAAGVGQDTRTWTVRMVAFVVAGALVGIMAAGLRTRARTLERLNEQVVAAFVRAIDTTHRDMAEHSTTVAATAAALAETLGLGECEVERVRWAALLHDIGKLSVPREIIRKSGSLSEPEWELVRAHPLESERILQGIDQFRPYLPGIRHHHERYDGGGYPDGLRGSEIPLEARIIAVADTLDAITANRAYRPARPLHAALAEIHDGAGTQFDPHVSDALLALYNTTPGRPQPTSPPPPLPRRSPRLRTPQRDHDPPAPQSVPLRPDRQPTP